MNPFQGAITVIKYYKAKKQKTFTRGKLSCNCGMLKDYGVTTKFWHEDFCVIRKSKNKGSRK